MVVKRVAVYAAVFSGGALAVVGAMALGGVFPAQAPTLVAPVPGVTGTVAPEEEPGVAAESTPIGSLVRNTFVTVSGTVERITDEDEFIIADTTGSVKVWTGSPFGPISPGEQLVVRGFVDDDLLLELYAQEIVKEDGTVLELRSYGG